MKAAPLGSAPSSFHTPSTKAQPFFFYSHTPGSMAHPPNLQDLLTLSPPRNLRTSNEATHYNTVVQYLQKQFGPLQEQSRGWWESRECPLIRQKKKGEGYVAIHWFWFWGDTWQTAGEVFKKKGPFHERKKRARELEKREKAQIGRTLV